MPFLPAPTSVAELWGYFLWAPVPQNCGKQKVTNLAEGKLITPSPPNNFQKNPPSLCAFPLPQSSYPIQAIIFGPKSINFMPQADRLKHLMEKHSLDTLSREEFTELLDMIRDPGNESQVKSLLTSDLENIPRENYDQPFWDQFFSGMMQSRKAPVRKLFPGSRPAFIRWVAAAAILVFVVMGVWFLTRSPFGNDKQPQAKIETNINDIPAPTATRAVITLADGTRVYLDSADSGTIAQQSGTNLIKNTNGEISYQLNTNSHQLTTNSPLAYNTLQNPRGSRLIMLTLTDGTKVWLNAGSSLRYPTAFTGTTREVEITGEAYFEVAHDASKPFKVALPGKVGEVEVLGTHFNVNAYEDEDALKVTLLEGSVKLTSHPQKSTANSHQLKDNSITIKPGQQAVLTNSYQLTANSQVDLDAVMAWQHGTFEFNKTELPVIMRQISRWYDVDIVYEGQPSNTKYGGGISRNLPLSDVLDLLKANGVKFRLEGKKLIVQS
jgi:ferric-dicitrate binding protein FerR (iron transport regulator)